MKEKIIANNKLQLQKLIEKEIKEHGNECDLNHIDVSNVNDMSTLFAHSKFNGNISNWDVSKVKNMKALFMYSKFTGDISEWDVSSVTDMSYMFEGAEFNSDISKWNVSNVENMKGMLNNSQFSYSLEDWVPTKLDKMGSMYYNCPAPIPYWGNYVDMELRNKAITAYALQKQLSEELNVNGNSKKKLKI
jgi:surface protein